MTRNDIQTYIRLKHDIYDESESLFDYIKCNYPDALEYGDMSVFMCCVPCNETMKIEYKYHDMDDITSCIDVPIDEFLDRPRQWADQWAAHILDEKEQYNTQQRELKNLYKEIFNNIRYR